MPDFDEVTEFIYCAARFADDAATAAATNKRAYPYNKLIAIQSQLAGLLEELDATPDAIATAIRMTDGVVNLLEEGGELVDLEGTEAGERYAAAYHYLDNVREELQGLS